MSLLTFTAIRQRVNYLIGDTSATTSGIIDSHINSAVADITNAYPFSWDVKQTTGTLAGTGPQYYSFSLASDYNPKWHVTDARIVNSSVGMDSIFQEIVPQDRNNYPPQTYKYYLLYDTVANAYVFWTPEPAGLAVTYQYNFQPTTLVNGSDVCIVPDPEAVCYLAASKNWLTDERNQALMGVYKQEASTRIQSMWQTDNAFGPVPSEGAAVDYNDYLLRR